MADYGVYGRGLTAKSVANSLREADDYLGSQSYWQYAEGQLKNMYSDTEFALQDQYREAIGQAYSSSVRQQQLAENARLVGQGASEYKKGVSDAYQQAYDAYQQSLSENRRSNEQSYIESLSSIQSQLQNRSQQFADFGESHYDYLRYLYDTYFESGTGPWSEKSWQNMFLTTTTNSEEEGVVPLLDEKGNQLTDENGSPLYQRLKTRGELYNTSYWKDDTSKQEEELLQVQSALQVMERTSYDPKTVFGSKYDQLKAKEEELLNYLQDDGEQIYSSVYDESGNLTAFGNQYFDLLENYSYGNGVTTFGEWLHDTNEDLYNFAFNEENIYDISSKDRTNAGTFRELTGRTSDDYTYSTAEHFGAMTKGTIKSFFNDSYAKMDEIFKGNMKNNAKKAIGRTDEIIDSISKLSKDLGLEMEFGDDLWDKLKSTAKQAYAYTKSSGEMTWDWFKTTLGWSVTGTELGAAAGTIMGGPGVGTVAGIIAGDVAGFVYGVVDASINTDNQRKLNKQMADTVKSQFKNAIDSMVAYSIAKHTEQLSG